MIDKLPYWKALSYQRKHRVLWILTGIFGLIAYQLAITPTLQAYLRYQTLTELVGQGTSVPGKLQQLRHELSRASAYTVTDRTDNNRKYPLLTGLAPLCRRHGVRIDALVPARQEPLGNHSVVTRLVRLQGNYLALVQVIHQLEYQLQAGRLASVQFTVQEDLLRGKRLLYADCYLQQLHESGDNDQQTNIR